MNVSEAKQSIRDTIDAYSGAAGRLNIEEFVGFFTEDGEVHGVAGLLGQPEPLKGHDQISQFFGTSFERLSWLVQQNTTTDISLSDDKKHATATTGLVEMAQREGADMIVLVARYQDELVLTDKGWRFSKRRLIPLSFKSVP